MEMTMEVVLNRNLLKHAAGITMFCPKGGEILDRATTVLVTVGNVTKTLCAKCWDRVKAEFLASAAARNVKAEVLDGRELFAKSVPAPNAVPDRNAFHAKDVAVGKSYTMTHHGNGEIVATVIGTKIDRWSKRTHYICRNNRTGNTITVKSAAKFRREVVQDSNGRWVKC